jgi:hypothetical protein
MFMTLLGALSPGAARGEDAPATAMQIVTQVTRLGNAGQHAQAAELAAAGAAREDLSRAERAGLAGLAGRSFELSYEAGGSLTELCRLAAVMRLGASLDTAEGGAAKRAAAAKAEAQLERAAGPGWRAVCEPASPITATTPERDAPAAVNSGPEPATTTTSRSPRDVNAAPSASSRDRGRVRAGVGTLVPGLVLFAPMAAVLVVRGAAERDLKALQADVAGRRLTDAERAQVEALGRRCGARGHRGRAGRDRGCPVGDRGSALIGGGGPLGGPGRRRPRAGRKILTCAISSKPIDFALCDPSP